MDDSDSKKEQKEIMGGFKGNLYQVKLLILFFYRGLSLNYEYELGTEIKEAEKFDDLVFKYVNKSDEKEHFVMIQAKLKMEKSYKIKITDLLTDGDVNFGLVKYFNSFSKMKNNKFFKNGIIDYVIVYTNTEFDANMKEKFKNDITEGDLNEESVLDLCKFGKDGQIYRFKPEMLLKKLVPLIRKYLCEYYRIAEKLVNVLLKNNTLLPNEVPFKKYHRLLVEEVIDVSKKSFRKEFIEGRENDSEGLKYFRKVLTEVLKANAKDLDDVKGSIFKISNQFGKTDDAQSWPEEKHEISFQDVEEFSEKFIFLSNQPDETDLDEMMENELRDKYYLDVHLYNTLFKEITVWMAGNTFKGSTSIANERFISSKNARQFLTRINEDKNEFASKMTTDEYAKAVSEFNVSFDDAIMKENLENFFNSKRKVLNIFSDYTKLTSMKVYQIIKLLLEKIPKIANNLIFVRLSMLMKSPIDHYAIQSFESKLLDNSLVIECDISDLEMKEISIAKQLCDILQNGRNKKITLISSADNSFSKKMNSEMECENKTDLISFVDDLTVDSQNSILEKCIVSFQGRDMNLKRIINENSNLIDPKVLTQIVNQEKISLGKKYVELQDIKQYYVSRKLLFELRLDDNITLLITGFDEIDFTTFSSSRFFKNYSVDLNISNENVSESDECVYYDLMCNEFDKQICLLKKVDDKIKFVRKNSRFTLKSNEIKKALKEMFESEVVFLSAVPGMGKSSIFSNWCDLIKENNPDLWVYKIDLINFSKTLDNMQKNDENFMDFMSVALNLGTNFELELFKKFSREGKLVLFFDGFDEVSQYRKQVMSLVRSLNGLSKNNKIFISSRPINDMTKGDFKMATCKLQPFTKQEQYEFLKKFWKVPENSMQNSFENSVESLLKDLRKKINDNGMEFSSIALHLYMIGVTFKNRFDDSNESENHHDAEEITKISQLYESFIRAKCYDVLYSSKMKLELEKKAIGKMARSYYASFMENNKLLALNSAFTDDQLNVLLTQTQMDQLKKCKEEIDDSGDDMGIIVRIVDKKPFFIHKTFAEYFIAFFFIGTFVEENAPNNLTIAGFFLNKILDETNLTICNFFDDMLNDEINEKFVKIGIRGVVNDLNAGKLDLAISHKWRYIVKLLINNDIEMLNIDQSKGSILHSAIYLNQNTSYGVDDEIFSTLIENLMEKPEILKILLEKVDSFGQTAFSCAVAYGNLKTIEKLFKVMENLEILNLNEIIGFNKDNLLHSASLNFYDGVFEFVLSKISGNSDSSENFLLGVNNTNSTPLMSAIESAQNSIVKKLIEEYDNSNQLIEVIKIKNVINDNIIHVTARGCNENLMEIVIEGLKKYKDELKMLLLEKNMDGDTPLFLLITYEKFNDVKILMRTFEDLEIVESAFLNWNYNNENALHLAAQTEGDCLNLLLEHLESRPEIFKKLFETTEIDENPLYYAATMDKVENMKILIRKTRDLGIFEKAVVVKNANDYNILHLTVRSDTETLQFFLKELENHSEILKTLLREREKSGSTPLLLGVFFDCLKNVKLLIAITRSLDMLEEALDSENKNNSNLLHMATMKTNKVCLQYFSEELKNYPKLLHKFMTSENSEKYTPLLVACHFANVNNIKYLVDLSKYLEILEKTIDVQNENSDNVLHLTSKAKNDDCLRLLLGELKNFPNVLLKLLEAKNREGLTPIFLIVENGHVNILIDLIKTCSELKILKSVIDVENNEGENILHLTAKMESDDFLQSILENLKSDKEILRSMLGKVDKIGKTPLILAEEHNYVIDLLKF